MIPEHLEESHRAYEILENPFLKLIIYTVLADQGEPLPEGAGTVEEAVIANLRNKAYSVRFGLMQARYLEGELYMLNELLYWVAMRVRSCWRLIARSVNM